MQAPSIGASLVDRFRRHWVAIAVLLGVSIAAAVALPRMLLGPRVAVVAVQQRDFVQTIVASGRVETPHRVSLGVQVAGVAAAVPAVEGRRVAKGDPLLVLDSAELQSALAQADAGVHQAQARLRQVEEIQGPVAEQALQQALSNHRVSQASLARSRELHGKGFIGRAALDEAERSERVASAQVVGAERQLAGTRPAGSDVAAARAALAQTQAAVQAARARLAYAVVRAPAGGTVIRRNVEPGDTVQPGKVLLVLAPDGEAQLVVQVDERHLGLLREGQRAVASADAYGRERFDAELVFVHPGVDAQRGSVEVKLKVASPPAYLRQDMTVSVDIEVATRPQAVLVPAHALRDAGEAAATVWKVDRGRVVRQPVRLGFRTTDWAEVLQGLRAGEQLVPAGTPGISENSRVRPVPAPSS